MYGPDTDCRHWKSCRTCRKLIHPDAPIDCATCVIPDLSTFELAHEIENYDNFWSGFDRQEAREELARR